MKKWEYYVASLAKDSQAVTGFLNEFGKEGWELVTIYHGIYFFKRPIEDEKKAEEKERK